VAGGYIQIPMTFENYDRCSRVMAKKGLRVTRWLLDMFSGSFCASVDVF
jgi:hypothetical protein